MHIINEDYIPNFEQIDNGLSKIKCKCGCIFSATENDIELQIIPIKRENGVKKFFGARTTYRFCRYITCPKCYNKMQVKYKVVGDENE